MSFRIPVVLDGDGSGFNKMIDAATHKTEEFSGKAAGALKKVFGGDLTGGIAGGLLGGFGLGEVGRFVGEMAKEFNDKVKSIKLGVLETGLDPEIFQQFRNLGEVTGTGIEPFTNGLQKMSVALDKIREGGPESAKIIGDLHTLGLTVKDMDMSNAGKSFVAIFDQLHRLGSLDVAQRAAGQGLFGKGFARLEAGAQIGRESLAANTGMVEQESLDAANKRAKEKRVQTSLVEEVKDSFGEAASTTMHGAAWFGLMASAWGPLVLMRKRQQEAKERKAKEEDATRLKEQDEKVRAEQEEMAEKHRDLAEQQVLDKKSKEDAKIASKAAELEGKNNLARLTPQKRLAELKREHDLLANETRSFGLDDDGNVGKRLRLAQLQSEMIPLQSSLSKTGAHMNVDSLARIGGFAGTGGAMGATGHLAKLAKNSDHQVTLLQTIATAKKPGRVP